MDSAVMIDACIFIDYFRSKKKEKTVYAALNRQRRRLYVSAVAKYEVLAGAKENDLGEWLQIFDAIIVLAFDEATVDMARTIFRQLRQENKIIDLADILIAATAIVNDLPHATFNRNHFERIRGLRLA